MKQKNKKSNEPVTKDLLEKAFHGFEKRLDQKLAVLEARTEIKLDGLERRIDDNAQKYRDQILNSNDKIAKELEQMREDRTIEDGQNRRLKKQVDSHEERIKKLEHAQQALA